jgi:arylsulfatase A-like enzyme
MQRLAALPVLALVCAAIDTLLVRRAFPHRELGFELYGAAVVLWLAFGVLALIPAGLVGRWRRRRARARSEPQADAAGRARAHATLAAWMAGPVIVHASLSRHTGLGGELSGLLEWGALLDLALALLLVALIAWGTRALVQRAGAARVGATAALVGLLAGSLITFHQRRAPTHAAGAPAGAERPNVLLLVWDTARAKSLQPYGYERPTTPTLAKLAESSVLYRFARSASSYTLTSHLSMLTGVYPSHHGARLVRQVYDPGRTPTVAADFAAAGYRTGAFVGTSVLTARTQIAWRFEVFDDLVDPPVCDTHAWALVNDVQALLAGLVPALHNNGLPHWFQDFQRPAGEVLARAAAWIAESDPRPFFCLINLYDVHWPYLPGPEPRQRWVDPYHGPITGYLMRADGWDEDYKMSRADHDHVRQLYDAEMWDLDRQVGEFLDGLDLERTALVLTSDHGEALGENGLFEHDDVLECQVRVPLCVRPAGGTEPRVDATRVSGIDIAPTLLDLAGLYDPSQEAAGGGPRFTGHSLLRPIPERDLLVEDRDRPDPTKIRFALYHDRWKLERRQLGETIEHRLYDLSEGPNGLLDLSLVHPEVVEGLSRRLDELRSRWGADDEADQQVGGPFNADTLRGLGYVDVEGDG